MLCEEMGDVYGLLNKKYEIESTGSPRSYGQYFGI